MNPLEPANSKPTSIVNPDPPYYDTLWLVQPTRYRLVSLIS